MKKRTYDPNMESHPIFVRFLEANRLRRAGLDFKLQTGIYEFIETGSSKPAKFKGMELTTAYAGFSDGYCGNPQKNGGTFGMAKRKKDDDYYSGIETLLANEKSISELLESEEKLRGTGVSEEVCQGALNATRRRIYLQQYNLGRQANSLNE